MTPAQWQQFALAGVLLAWFVLGAIFLLRRRPKNEVVRTRANSSRMGIAIAAIGFAVIWGFNRPWWTHLFFMPAFVATLLALASVALAFLSVALMLFGLRTLGKQWATAARIIEGHRLITSGPYSFVRNPIYLGMLGLLLATGIAVSRWWALLLGAAFFLLGTWVRVRSEERVLREAFGAEFEEYTRRVPALFPRIFPR